MSEEIKESYLKLPIEYVEFYEKDLKQQIEDLQQKVEQLEKENISLKEANNYHQEVIKSMKEPENARHYHLENIKLRAINNQLENIRKEAIKYTEKEIKNMPLNGCKQRLTNLLNILNKGDNKE